MSCVEKYYDDEDHRLTAWEALAVVVLNFQLIDDIASWYQVYDTGGALHVVLDDTNVTDETLDWCTDSIHFAVIPWVDLARGFSILQRLRSLPVRHRALVAEVGSSEGYRRQMESS